MSKHIPRYYYHWTGRTEDDEEESQFAWRIFDRTDSSALCMAEASSRSVAIKITEALNVKG